MRRVMEEMIEQFVCEVTDYSSQYGSDGSVSYVANNIVGKPLLFPDYGDFSAAFCMRTYGKWWNLCPSASAPILGPKPVVATSVDFIDVKFEYAVLPNRIDIYEIYNPGSVIRIWGSLGGKCWSLLWSGEATTQPHLSRIFSPTLLQLNELVNFLRIEFDQSCQEYYSAFDAVLMVGIRCYLWQQDRDTIFSHVTDLGLHAISCPDDAISTTQFLSEENLNRFCAKVNNVSLTDFTKMDGDLKNNKALESIVNQNNSCGYFDLLPEELLLHILKQLDVQSLSRLSQTCRAMYKHTSDPILYIHLNLRRCWWFVNNASMSVLAVRCSLLQELDLSWCGAYGALDAETFMEFVHQCGQQLRILRLDNCRFVDNYCLYMIANVCLELEELSLANCTQVDHMGFGELKKAHNLYRLNLSCTRIDFHTLQLLLQHAKNLCHLCLNNCLLLDMDDIAVTLASFNRSLVSLGAWKTHGLTSRGLRALSCIATLQDLDFGWALSGVITDGLAELVRGCPDLQRLQLTALRTLTDTDLENVATHSFHLKQLDIMGTRNITPEAITRILSSCKCLQLLDLSFCEQICVTEMQRWLLQFPHVSIKGLVKDQVRLT